MQNREVAGVRRDLLERVKAATGPDRKLDGDIAYTLGLPQEFFNSFSKDVDGYPFPGFTPEAVDGPDCFDGPIWGGGGRTWEAPQFTASIDAALALVERLLPGEAVSFLHGVTWELHRGDITVERIPLLIIERLLSLAVIEALLAIDHQT